MGESEISDGAKAGHQRWAPGALVLGASNVARCRPVLLQVAQERLASGGNGLTQIAVAGGHGRSYGLSSRILGRELTSLLRCRLWRELDLSALRLAALTDIGNDVMYGVETERIVGWVAEIIERLPRSAEIVLVAPPLETLERLSPALFLALRTLLFPSHRRSLQRALADVDALRRGLEQLADALAQDPTNRRMRFVDPPGAWYGFDPIHFRRRAWRAVWTTILGPPRSPQETPYLRRGWASSIALRAARPACFKLFGVQVLAAQPAVRRDRLEVAFY